MTKRVAISLPDDLFQRIERARKRKRMPRSTWIQEAVGEYARRADDTALEQSYFDGYRRTPDGDDADFEAIERVGIEDLKKARLA